MELWSSLPCSQESLRLTISWTKWIQSSYWSRIQGVLLIRSQNGSCRASFVTFEDAVWHKASVIVAVLKPELKTRSVSLRSISIFCSHLPLHISIGLLAPKSFTTVVTNFSLYTISFQGHFQWSNVDLVFRYCNTVDVWSVKQIRNAEESRLWNLVFYIFTCRTSFFQRILYFISILVMRKRGLSIIETSMWIQARNSSKTRVTDWDIPRPV
jgi:hypothetical protein